MVGRGRPGCGSLTGTGPRYRYRMLPDEPLPVRLINTIGADRSGVHAASADDLARFRRLRDALRRLAALLTDDTRVEAASPTPTVERAIADLNDAAALAPTWPRLELRDGALHLDAAGKATHARRA